MTPQPTNNTQTFCPHGSPICADCGAYTNNTQYLEDNELRSAVARIADYFVDMGQPDTGQDGWYISYDKKLDELLQLITQQQLEAEKLGAKKLHNIIRNSPDPRTDVERYLRELEKGTRSE